MPIGPGGHAHRPRGPCGSSRAESSRPTPPFPLHPSRIVSLAPGLSVAHVSNRLGAGRWSRPRTWAHCDSGPPWPRRWTQQCPAARETIRQDGAARWCGRRDDSSGRCGAVVRPARRFVRTVRRGGAAGETIRDRLGPGRAPGRRCCEVRCDTPARWFGHEPSNQPLRQPLAPGAGTAPGRGRLELPGLRDADPAPGTTWPCAHLLHECVPTACLPLPGRCPTQRHDPHTPAGRSPACSQPRAISRPATER
jgi:hypothetical protein